MKKCYFLILLMALICFVLPASGEEAEYSFDVADEITVGLGETIIIPYERPMVDLTSFRMVCSDEEAMNFSKDTERGQNGYLTGCYKPYFEKKGTFTLSFQLVDDQTEEARTIHTVRVTVDDLATKASVSQERFILRAGETVNTGLTLENGAMYNLPTFTKDAYYDSFVQISENGLTLKGLSKGHMMVHVINPLKQELCQFEVVVVEESENVELSCPQEYAVVGKNLTLSAKSNGEEAFPLVTITEGSECVQWDGDSRVWSFYPSAPGWVTFTAYGTDGSTSSVRIRVLSGENDIVYDIPKTTLAAGESLEVSVLFPSDAWCTITMNRPAEQGLEGTVALVNEHRLTAVTAGTCNLVINSVGVSKVVPITVTDSPQALTVIRPNPYMDMESSFQLSVQDKLGNQYPAQYSASGYVSVDENGLLTPKEFAGNATVQVELENGAGYSFEMWTKRFPKELTCTAEEIVLPLNDQLQGLNSNGTIGNIIYDELGAVSSNDLVVCSDDPSIVETELEGNRLYPRRVGNTTLTVWSKYCDLSVRVPVRITEPMDLLYVDGRDSYADLQMVEGTTVSLPTVTDYYGNQVRVTWKIQSSTKLHDRPNVNAFSLVNNGTKIKCLEDGYNSLSATVVATSQKGATLTLYVRAYLPYEMFELSPKESQITTGSWEQIHVNGKKDNNDSAPRTMGKDDFTYTLTGDTDCVSIEPYMPHYCILYGLKPGTVTLTVKLRNGVTHSSVIQVVLPDVCQNGHDPVWKTEEENTVLSKGTEALRCSRCNADLGERRETPATGVISFAEQNFYLQPGQEIDLMTQLDGNRHYSFTWESSDPSVARVVGDKLTVYDFGETTITAYAYDCNPGTCYVHVIDPNADMIAYGDWLNLHWTLDKEGLLTISGTGAMDDFELHNDRAAWHLYSSQIKRVVIEAGVTSIGANAFEFCGKFTEISIPDTVTVIGNYAMNACSSLTEIHVPASVTAIGEGAFMDNWYLEAIHVDADNPVYRSISGVLFSKDQRLLIQYPSANPRTVYEIPAGVEVIGERAFHHSSNLTEITISSGVTKIGRDAFTACENLASVTIPEGVTEIGSSAFAICQNLTSAAIPEGVSTLEMSLFDGCWKLASVSIPASVTKIGKYAFSLCYGLKDVYYHGTEDDWAGIEVEYGNDDLLKANLHCAPDLVPQLILPASLTTIESEAFQGLPEGIVVFIPNAVTSIAEDAFDTGMVIVTPSGSFAAQWGREHGFEVHEQ